MRIFFDSCYITLTASIHNYSEFVHFTTWTRTADMIGGARYIEQSHPFISCYHGYGSCIYLHIPSVPSSWPCWLYGNKPGHPIQYFRFFHHDIVILTGNGNDLCLKFCGTKYSFREGILLLCNFVVFLCFCVLLACAFFLYLVSNFGKIALTLKK